MKQFMVGVTDDRVSQTVDLDRGGAVEQTVKHGRITRVEGEESHGGVDIAFRVKCQHVHG